MIGTVCFCFVFALNLLNDWSVSFDMKFDGVSDLGNYELTLCFFYVLVINYTLEMGLRYIKFRKWYGWIWYWYIYEIIIIQIQFKLNKIKYINK